MLVIDGLRRLTEGKLRVPQFHLGHLGFVPGLRVNCRHANSDDKGGQELTLTPFQGHKNELFLLKFVFRDRPGVVSSALSAFAALQLNVLSLESATIDRGRTHVLFCILSWNTSKYPQPIPLADGTKQKFIDLLPLLPIADWRYLLLLQVLFLFCGNALDYEEIPANRRLPKLSMKLFDAFQDTQGSWNTLRVEVERQSPSAEKRKRSSVFFDLKDMVRSARGSGDEGPEVILLSETETKTLRLIFPGTHRQQRFLHIAFVHLNQPGALLAISKLVRRCGFNIMTSLLRKHDETNNVWETMLEVADEADGHAQLKSIPRGIEGINLFREWCFNATSLSARRTDELIKFMVGYNVRVCRPSYPRNRQDNDSDFDPIDILAGLDATLRRPAESIKVTFEEFEVKLAELERLGESPGPWQWLVPLIYSDLQQHTRHNKHRGTVFVSLPAHCEAHLKIMTEMFASELRLKVESSIDQHGGDICMTALKKIRESDFFFALWHPDRNHAGEISPWMPFEWGAARALGKPEAMLFHKSLRDDVRHRIDPSTSAIQYEDLTFREKLKGEVFERCRRTWFEQSAADLYLEFERTGAPLA